MIKLGKNLYERYQQIIIYIMCSGFTLVLESLIGYGLKYGLCVDLVIANSIGMIIGMIAHYLLISKKVFKVKYTLWSLFVYIFSFMIGFILQNILLLVFYKAVFKQVNELFRFFGSKVISVVLPFFFMYFMRKKMYRIQIKNKSKN